MSKSPDHPSARQRPQLTLIQTSGLERERIAHELLMEVIQPRAENKSLTDALVAKLKPARKLRLVSSSASATAPDPAENL